MVAIGFLLVVLIFMVGALLAMLNEIKQLLSFICSALKSKANKKDEKVHYSEEELKSPEDDE